MYRDLSGWRKAMYASADRSSVSPVQWNVRDYEEKAVDRGGCSAVV